MSSLNRIPVCLPAVFAALLGGCEAVPERESNRYPGQPAYSYSDVRQCQRDNGRVHAEIHQIYQRARSEGRISPAEAQRFNALESRLRDLHAALSNDGLTLRECQRISDALARERQEVARMGRTDPAVGRCAADNARAHQDVVNRYENARRSGRINPAEAQRFNAMEGRLRNLRAALGRDGLSLQECQRIGAEIARERNEITRMSQYDPAISRCIADNRRAHDDALNRYDSARRAGRINPAEAQRFSSIEGRLKQLRAAYGRDGLTLQECQRIGESIARERQEIIRMAQ